ncbi:hypothetical protein JCM3770_000449 [Rhodotorula araucariae]
MRNLVDATSPVVPSVRNERKTCFPLSLFCTHGLKRSLGTSPCTALNRSRRSSTLPPAKPTLLRSVAFAVLAAGRMQRLSRTWKEQSAPKKRLPEQACQDARGKPCPG